MHGDSTRTTKVKILRALTRIFRQMTNRSQTSGQRNCGLSFFIGHWSLVIICQVSLRVLRVSAVRLLGCGWAAL